jgi:hypothetical protein
MEAYVMYGKTAACALMESAVQKRTKEIGPDEFQEKKCLIRATFFYQRCHRKGRRRKKCSFGPQAQPARVCRWSGV